MKRHGILAAGLLGSATALCLLLNRPGGLSATEDGEGSFREAQRRTAQPPAVEVEGGFRLNYFDAGWEKVLRQLATHHGLTLVMEETPPGRFARRDRREYDLDSALRLLNHELEPQGFRLLAQNDFLIVLNLDKARTEYARPQLIAPAAGSDGFAASGDKLEDEPGFNSASRTSAVRAAGNGEQRITRNQLTGDDSRTTPGQRRQPDASNLSGAPQPSRLKLVSHDNHYDEGPQVTPEADDGPVSVTAVDVSHAKVAELAKSIFVAFKDRAQLEEEGPGGLPGFRVFDVFNRPEAGDVEITDSTQFRVGIDQQGNRLLLEATPGRTRALKRVIASLDRPAGSDDESTVRILPNNGLQAETAEQLQKQIHQMVSLVDEGAATRPAQPPAELPADTPAQPGDESADSAINLRGEVNVQAMQELGILILQGNEADVEKVAQIIAQLERMSVGSLPSIHLHPLQNVDSEAMATLLTNVYTELSELRQRGGEDRPLASFIAVVQPNAVLILSSEIERADILKLTDLLDQPLDAEFEFEVFPLRSAIASQVVTALTSFYAERTGLGTNIRAIADVRTNSVIVQGRPSELTEVAKLIQRIDTDQSASVSRMRVFKLKNAVAEELATTINSALQAIISPPQQQTGGGFGGGFGGGGQGAQELRDNKSVALEFLTTTGGVQELIKSGILADVRVTADIRSNSLVVSAPEASMNLMEALVLELDRAPDAVSEIKVFTLKNADAQQSVDLLTTLFENTNQEEQLGVQIAGTEGSSSLIPLRFSADIRTNSVLSVGSAEALSVVEAILLRLDSDDTRQRQTGVIALKNAPADLVAQTLLDYLEQLASLQDSAEDLISNIERIRQEVLVSPDVTSNSLIVSASPQYYSQITGIIDTLDAQPPEVVIQALIVEVTLDQTDEFGIELGFQDPLLLRRGLTTATATTAVPGLNFNNTSVALGNNFTSAASDTSNVATQGLANFSLGRQNGNLGFGGFVFSAQSDAVSVLLRALAARRTVHVLSRPQIRATHNNLSTINVGQNVPLVDGVTITALGQTNPNIVRQRTGIILEVTPRVTPDGTIAMEVYAEKSALTDTDIPVFVNTDGSTITSPVINEAVADTIVTVPNGQTVVIGGMITKSDSTLERKVPWLGDLPMLGKLFRYDGTEIARTELLIFLTPRIVLTDLDAELIKQVETERMHFIESEAEEIHGPLYSVPAADLGADGLPPAGTIWGPDTPVDELLMQPVPDSLSESSEEP